MSVSMCVRFSSAFCFVGAEVIGVLSVGQLSVGKLLMAVVVSMYAIVAASFSLCCTTWRVAVAASCTVAGSLMLPNMLER